MSLALQFAAHHRLDGLPGVEVLVAKRVDEIADRHLDAELRGKVVDNLRVPDAFGHHLHRAENVLYLLALPKPLADGMVARVDRRAGDDEIAYTGEIRMQGKSGRRPRLAYVPQNLQMDSALPLTVAEFLSLGHQRRPLWLGIKGSASRRARAALAGRSPGP